MNLRHAGLAALAACAVSLGPDGQAFAGDTTWSTANASFSHTNWFERSGSPALIDSTGEIQLNKSDDAVMSRNHVVPDPQAACMRQNDTINPGGDVWWWTSTDLTFSLERFGQQTSNSEVEVIVYDATRNHYYYNMGLIWNVPAGKAVSEDITLSQFGKDDIAIEFTYLWGSGDTWAIWSPQIHTYGQGYYWGDPGIGGGPGVPAPASGCTYPPTSFWGSSPWYLTPTHD